LPKGLTIPKANEIQSQDLLGQLLAMNDDIASYKEGGKRQIEESKEV